jgi:hypothetical protein
LVDSTLLKIPYRRGFLAFAKILMVDHGHTGVVEIGRPRYDRLGHRVLLVGLNTRSVRSMAACSSFWLGGDSRLRFHTLLDAGTACSSCIVVVREF